MDLHDARHEYSGGALPDTIDNPWAFFEQWFLAALAEQQAGRVAEATAMVLGTVDADGQPSSRIVLAKAFGPGLGRHGGVDFYTSGESRKGRALQAHPAASLLFFWPSLHRQVHLEGRVAVKPVEEAETYFHQRPHASQVAAVVSRQSRPRNSRASLEEAFEQAMDRYEVGGVPRPDDWLGWRLEPHRIEFWQGMPGRLHDRMSCTLQPRTGTWHSERLDP